MKRILYIQAIAVLFFSITSLNPCADERWQAEVLPSERQTVRDDSSGSQLLFVTRSEADDTNAYFHQRSWLPDESMLFFWSSRTGRGEVFGCLEKTGELVRFQRDGDDSIYKFTAGIHKDVLYFARNRQVFEWHFTIEYSPNPSRTRSRVTVEEHHIGFFPPEAGDSMFGISESCRGEGLVVGFNCTDTSKYRIVLIEKNSGQTREIATVDYPISHIQCSWKTPGLVCFARNYLDPAGDWAMQLKEGELRARIHLADLSEREPWPIYPQVQGELVTHECWWVNDQITFCSGQHKNGNSEQAHVKVYDPRIDRTYIIGPGSWWDGCGPKEVSQYNYWHASGSPDGKFVAGDNWHGMISLFSAKTARTRLLTKDHRVYGKGAHPHVGWSPSSKKVVFASNRFGNADVCIAIIPDEWLNNEW